MSEIIPGMDIKNPAYINYVNYYIDLSDNSVKYKLLRADEETDYFHTDVWYFKFYVINEDYDLRSFKIKTQVIGAKSRNVLKEMSNPAPGCIYLSASKDSPLFVMSVERSFLDMKIKIEYSYEDKDYDFIFDVETVKLKQPYGSWTFDENTGLWNAPKPLPSDHPLGPLAYSWNEEIEEWEEIGFELDD